MKCGSFSFGKLLRTFAAPWKQFVKHFSKNMILDENTGNHLWVFLVNKIYKFVNDFEYRYTWHMNVVLSVLESLERLQYHQLPWKNSFSIKKNGILNENNPIRAFLLQSFFFNNFENMCCMNLVLSVLESWVHKLSKTLRITFICQLCN